MTDTEILDWLENIKPDVQWNAGFINDGANVLIAYDRGDTFHFGQSLRDCVIKANKDK